jgi:hypothetical protein
MIRSGFIRSASETRSSSPTGASPSTEPRARLVADAVLEQARQLQLGRGLADDDTLLGRDLASERVQERRLPRGDAPADDDVAAGADAGGEERRRLRAQKAQLLELCE